MSARRDVVRFGCVALMLIVAGCNDPASAPSVSAATPFAGKAPPTSGPTVTSALPSEANRDTTLDVQITGSGFDSGSRASFERNGVVDARVRVNSTRFVKSTSLVANVTIAADAVAELYNVAVVTGGGKKGIGTELFAVTIEATALVGGSRVRGVNASGDAAGLGTGAVQCSVQTLPFMWRNDGSRISLPIGTYCGGEGDEINQSGAILGVLFGGGIWSQVALWTPSDTGYTVQVLPPAPDGYPPVRGGLTDSSEVIGWDQHIAGLYWWSAATGWLPMQLPTGATRCMVRSAINNLGAIAGNCSIAGGPYDGYYWPDHKSSPILLPRPAGTGDVIANDINDAGVIVGNVHGKAVKWTPNGSGGYAVTLLPDIGFSSSAYAIAQDGTVAGSVTRTNGLARPALWSPSGELTMLGLNKNGDNGEALSVAVTPTGIVVGGVLTSLGATLWKIAP